MIEINDDVERAVETVSSRLFVSENFADDIRQYASQNSWITAWFDRDKDALP